MKKLAISNSYMIKNVFLLLVISLVFSACKDDEDLIDNTPETVVEAEAILAQHTRDGGTAFDPSTAVNYPSDVNSYYPSLLGLSLKLRDGVTNLTGPICTLPMYKGLDGNGNEIYYIITESSDIDAAKALGIPYTPRMANARGSGGVQNATINDGVLSFQGTVDFSASRSVTPGVGNVAPLAQFPPAAVSPGAEADALWSDFVVLPSGNVMNCQAVANSTGIHDRIPHHGPIGEDNQSNPYIDSSTGRVTMQVLDGWASGRRYFYHLVTSASDPGPSAIELAYFSPRLNNLPTFGVYPDGSLLPFSPNSNGPDNADQETSQGLNVASQFNQVIDPVNVFPFGPDNLNFSPMWDAHISMWTQDAIDAGERRIITGFADLTNLVEDGLLTNFVGNMSSPSNQFVAGLSPTGALINCPVIAHPFDSAIGQLYGNVLKP